MKSIIAISLLVIMLPATLVGQGVEWAVSLNGWSSDKDGSLCADSIGNVYTTGKISSGTIAGTPITVNGRYDTYLAKFDPVGTLIWAVTAGGSDPDDPNEQDGGDDVKYDAFSNSLYVSGGYEGQTFGNQAVFGPGIEVSGKGAYLAKYDLDGNCLWVRTTNNGGGGSITVDQHGQIYMYLLTNDWYSPNTTFAGPPVIVLPNGPIIAKFSSTGSLLWAKDLGSNIDGKIIVQDTNLYFAGGTYGDSSTLLGTTLPITGTINQSAIIAAIDSSGTTINWLRTYGSSMGSAIVNFKAKTSGEFVITGAFKDSLFLSSDTLIGASDTFWPFHAQVNVNGIMDWIQTFPANLVSTNVETLMDGSMYLGIVFSDSFTIPGGTVNATSARDFAVIRCLPDGTPIGAVHFGEVNNGFIHMQSTDESGLIIGGRFSNSLDLGVGHVLSGSYDDLFIAKLGAITGVSSFQIGGIPQLHIYANPNNGLCTVELPTALRFTPNLVLTVYNNAGAEVQRVPLRATDDGVRLDITAQAKGSYHVEVSDGTQRYSGTIVFE